MAKSLEDAIGCWTTNPNWNTLPYLGKLVAQSARSCCTYTKQGRIDKLKCELEWLHKRLDSMMELTQSAEERLKKIISTNELEAK